MQCGILVLTDGTRKAMKTSVGLSGRCACKMHSNCCAVCNVLLCRGNQCTVQEISFSVAHPVTVPHVSYSSSPFLEILDLVPRRELVRRPTTDWTLSCSVG
jgi:hypothetical protein